MSAASAITTRATTYGGRNALVGVTEHSALIDQEGIPCVEIIAETPSSIQPLLRFLPRPQCLTLALPFLWSALAIMCRFQKFWRF